MKKRSLGMIETWGYVPAVEAADAGTKAANVTFIGYEITRVALITVKFTGDVAAVKAAVNAGEQAARKVGKVVAVHVIPRPAPQLSIEPPDKSPPSVQHLKEEGPEAKSESELLSEEASEAKPELELSSEEDLEAKSESELSSEEASEVKPEPELSKKEEDEERPESATFPKGKGRKLPKAKPIKKSKKN